MATHLKLLSGRVPVTPYDQLSNNRYEFLSLDEAEPSLGSGTANSILTLSTGNTRVWSNALTIETLTVNGESNLGAVGNVIITGGTAGYVLSTDGSGNLSFVSPSSSQTPAPMPIEIDTGNTLTIPANYQGLFGVPLVINGTLEVDGVLFDVNAGGGNGTPGGNTTQVQFNNSGNFAGSANFTFDSANNILSTPEIRVSGNIVPTANITYNLGTSSNRFNDLYLAGNTIELGSALISTTETGLIFTNPLGGTFTVNGDSNSNSSSIVNGSTDISIPTSNGNINMQVAGNANVLVLTGSGANLTGTFTASTIITPGNLSSGNANLGNLARANFFQGDGSLLTNITVSGGTAITNELSNVSVAANANVTVSIQGNANVVTFAQTNTFFNSNILANSNISASGNITGGNINTSGAISAAGKVTMGAVAYENTDGTNGQVLTTYGNGVTYWSTVSGGGSGASISNGTSNVNIATSGGNVTVGVASNANIAVITGTGVNVNGTLSVSGNMSGGNIGGIIRPTAGNGSAGIIFPADPGGGGGDLATIQYYVESGESTVLELKVTNDVISPSGPDYIRLNAAGGTVIDNTLTVTSSISTSGSMSATGNITGNFFLGNGSQLTGVSAQSIPAANITGTTLSNNVVISSLTSVGTLTSLSVSGNANIGNIGTAGIVSATGNVTGNFFIGNGSQLTGITANAVNAANITGTTLSSNVVSSSLTAVGTLTTLSVSGNANVGNIGTAGLITATGNVIAGNLVTAGVVSATGNITAANVSGGNLVTANFFQGDGYLISNLTVPAGTALVNGTSNLYVDGSGNVRTSVAGTANVWVVRNTGANLTGTLSVSGNANIGNVDTTVLSASGNITGSNLITSGLVNATGNGTFGNVSGGNLVSANFISGTLTTASQPNITSVGILSSLTVTGNVITGNISGNGSALSALTFANITTFTTAGLTTDELYLQSITRLNVSANGSSAYNFDQYGSSNNNPTLYVSSGQTIAFNLNVSGHPFLIQSSNSANYSTGLSHVDTSGTVSTDSSAQGKISGTLYWKIPYGITGNYKYQCSVHGGMNGNIVISDANTANLNVSTAVTSGTVTTASQPNITSVGTLSSLSVSGNLTAGNLLGIFANGNSNISIPSSNGNINISAGGAANELVITSTGINVAGYINSTGNLTVGAKSNLGPASNVIITGGTANYVLSTDGAGNLSWVAQSGGNGGGSANIAIYDDGVLLTNTVTSLDFVGAGVTANANGNAITVTINGGGGGGSTAGYQTRTYTGNGVQANFTVSSGSTANSLIVTENGVVQTPDTDYTVSSTTLTFTTAPASNVAIQIRELAIGGTLYASAAANVSAVGNTRYILNTNSSNIVVTLPSPSFGTEVGIIDGTGNANVNNITVYGNGANIQGSNANMTVDTSRAAFTLVYYNATQGWLLTNV